MFKNFTAEQLARAIEPELRWLRNIRYSVELKPAFQAYRYNLLRLPLLLFDRWKYEYHDWKQRKK